MNPSQPLILSSTSSRLLALTVIASLTSLPMTASGAVAIGVSSVPLDFYESDPMTPISNSDLVNTGSPDLMFFSSTDFGTPTGMNDGTLGSYSGIDEDVGEFPAITTFHLNVVANPLGYEISQLRVFTWNLPDGVETIGFVGPFDGHHYIVDYSLVGSADFETLATVDISGAGGSSLTWVTLNPVPVLTGVDVIRFTWLDPVVTPYSASLIAEVDIEGTPVTQVPEPSSFMLGALVLGGTCLRRNRR
jgi:hypothetical protein